MSQDYVPDDVERVQQMIGVIHPSGLPELDKALRENRDGVFAVAQQIANNPGVISRPAVCLSALKRGDHRRRQRMSTTGNPAPQRIPPAEALRRLYDAKVSDLARYEIPVAQRRVFALDFACGEVWRCSTTPMPSGGLIQLERELCAELGIDRFTGERVQTP
jgi:hypothetical protein